MSLGAHHANGLSDTRMVVHAARGGVHFLSLSPALP